MERVRLKVRGSSWDDEERDVAGQSLTWFEGTSANAVREEIAQARLLRMQRLGLRDRTADASLVREREVVTREIVKIPCRYCGALVEQTAQRCPSCGAPLGRP